MPIGIPLAHSDPLVSIETIEGKASEITLTLPGGMRQVAATKGEIPKGTKIETTKASGIRLRYAEGSEIKVGHDTELTLEATQPGEISSSLENGHLRAFVMKASPSSATQEKPRFWVRTKTSTMGVRGTDFTVDTDRVSKSVHVLTLEGVVDVAQDAKDFESGKVQRVQAGEGLERTSDGSVKRFHFTPGEYDHEKSVRVQQEPASFFARVWAKLKRLAHRVGF